MAVSSPDLRRVPAERVRRQIELVLRAWGMAEDQLAVTASVLVEADLIGVDSHGISMLLLYSRMHARGQLRLKAVPKIVRESATTAVIDAGGGLGQFASVTAMNLAIDKALAHDVGVVSVTNSHHHGVLRYYAEMATRRGLVALVSSSTRMLSQVPTFGAEKLLGTNPFAFAAPAGRHPPVILDMATSVVAINKVKIYHLEDRPIPAQWMVDGDGRPVTDSHAAYQSLFFDGEGGLNPLGGHGKEIGGHKGYGLAVFAQILSATLVGASFSPIRNRTQKPEDPDNLGHFFFVLDPNAFRPLAEFEADMEELVDTLHATRPADPAQPVLVPGDPEAAAREERSANGIPLSAGLLAAIAEIAAAAKADFVLDD